MRFFLSALVILFAVGFCFPTNDYQKEAERQAAQKAKFGIGGHVGAVIGDFEGVGHSTGPNPPTCRPRFIWRYKLVADATVQNKKTGIYYRVRAWVRR